MNPYLPCTLCSLHSSSLCADDVSNLVSPISVHRAAVTKDGRHVCTDVFTVYGDDVVDRLLGQGVLVVQHTKNRAAVTVCYEEALFVPGL